MGETGASVYGEDRQGGGWVAEGLVGEIDLRGVDDAGGMGECLREECGGKGYEDEEKFEQASDLGGECWRIADYSKQLQISSCTLTPRRTWNDQGRASARAKVCTGRVPLRRPD